ncbi:RHS repeat-associated core domain-containing protein [Diaphorobacter aerolatus]|nr:RHS repeat-associated core domain-containing protein [Diaphorobacter aerolatus]
MSRFAYDAAGRLTGADTPQAGQQRWRFDPAGNRLPIAEPAGNPGAGDVITGALNETDRQRTQQRAGREATPVSREQMARSDYNALQGKPEQGGHLEDWAATAKWHGNRVGYYENSEDASSEGARIHYRYDSRGNRTESVQGMAGKARRKMELAYDKGNQLVQVVVHEKDDGEEEEGTQLTQRYRYDAFGRRLAKYSNAGNTGHASNLGHMGHKDAGEESGTTDYFGWDGDRLVHTERLNHGNARDINGQSQPEIVHTVYEPGSFTPLVQLRRAARAAPGMADDLIAHLPAGMARDALRAMLTDINATSALLNERIVGLGMAADAQSFINAQRQEFEETARSERQENAKSVEVRHYLCDHLGTPNALFSSEGQVEWAATLDAWGNVKDEYSPKRLYQPIRLPGQHEDDATGLYYNRYRYYESISGSYINQDLIKHKGGINFYIYPLNTLLFVDPLGLQAISVDNQSSVPSNPELRPDGQPWGAGCGDAKTDKYIPDSYFGEASFLGACSAHDRCYGTWQADKNQCDDKLRDDMKQACDEANAAGKIGLPAVCRFQASVYHFVLKDINKGQPAYDAAQEEAFWEIMSNK